ncbi:MAG: DUF4890 domain-containing protein [Bacteroidales bacterium]|nr:MAG: DUF4890 domain-containing protein [Bacteroidales bacterium]
MKRITILTAAAALIMGTASAQDFGSQQRPERKQFTPEQIAERRVESLGKTLELTDEQKKEIYEIYLANAAEQQQEMEAMRKAMQQQREKAAGASEKHSMRRCRRYSMHHSIRNGRSSSRLCRAAAASPHRAVSSVRAAVKEGSAARVKAAVSTTAWDFKHSVLSSSKNPI